MRWVAIIISLVTFGLALMVSLVTFGLALMVSLVILGLGMFLFFLSFILINRSSNTGFMVIGVFFVLVGLGSLWMLYRARMRNGPTRWRFLDH